MTIPMLIKVSEMCDFKKIDEILIMLMTIAMMMGTIQYEVIVR